MIHVAPVTQPLTLHTCSEVYWCTKTWQGWRMVSVHLHLIVLTAQGQAAHAQQMRSKQIYHNVCLVFSWFLTPRSVCRYEWPGYHWSAKASCNPSDISPCSCVPRLQDTVLISVVGSCNYDLRQRVTLEFTASKPVQLTGVYFQMLLMWRMLSNGLCWSHTAFVCASLIYRFPFSFKAVVILSPGILDGFNIEYCEACSNAG